MKKLNLSHGWIAHEPQFMSFTNADELYKHLLHQLNWQGGDITLFGKTYPIPRKQVYFSEPHLGYSYSGKSLTIIPWDDQVFSLKQKIESFIQAEFNACLANLYRNGLDSNGWHADNEKELGINPIIASISLGATRKFSLKHRETGELLHVNLQHGSLFVMGGELQHYWKHTVPKEPKIKEPRINLTFRKVLPLKID